MRRRRNPQRRSVKEGQMALFTGSQAGAGRRFGMSKILTAGESKRGEARVWLQGGWLEDLGYSEGQTYKVSYDPLAREVTLYLVGNEKGARKVSRQRKKPLIEVTTKALTETLAGAEKVIIETNQGEIIIRPASIPRIIAERRADGTEGSIFTGAGFLSEAARLAGYEPVWGVEIEERNAAIYAANHPRAIPINLPVEEAVMLNWQLQGLGRPLLSQVELLTGGIPCQPFSRSWTRKRAKGSDRLREPRDHELIAMTHWMLSVVQQVNPLNIVIEEVEHYLESESFAVLAQALSVMGYFVRSKVIDPPELGSLAGRRRAVIVATTSAYYSFPQPQAPAHTAGDLLYSPDEIEAMTAAGRWGYTAADGGVSKRGTRQRHPKTQGAWFSMDDPPGDSRATYGPGAFLREKWGRPGFRPSIVYTGSTYVDSALPPTCRIGAVKKTYHKVQPENPYVAHPANRGTPQAPAPGDRYRMLTVDEIKRLHGVPDDYQLPESYRDAVEVLGQGVVVDAFQKVIAQLPHDKAGSMAEVAQVAANPPPAQVARRVASTIRRMSPQDRYELGADPCAVDGSCPPYAGLCYPAAEVVYHAGGGAQAGLTPVQVQHEGVSHWFVRGPQGGVYDPTEGQFRRRPSGDGRGRGFLTRRPSRRARDLAREAGVQLNPPPWGLSLEPTVGPFLIPWR